MPESKPPKAQPYKAYPWPLSDSTASPELAGWCGILGILCAGLSHHVVDGAAADAAAHRQAAGAQGWAAAACGWAAAAHLGITSTELDITPYSTHVCRTADSSPCGTTPASHGARNIYPTTAAVPCCRQHCCRQWLALPMPFADHQMSQSPV